MNKRPLVVLLDSHAIIHRGYHALPDLATSDGRPTGAIFGFLSMLSGIISQFKPDYVIATFDRAEKTFRHEAFDNYKGTRTKTDDSLITQINQVRTICSQINIPVLDAAGFEADDILGTLVKNIPDSFDIVIASGDMDTLQLVQGNRVRVFTLRKGLKDTVIYGEQEVIDRYKFGPTSVPDYKAFRGDTSDNIPGIRGIGEKTATELISTYKTLEEVYKNIDTLKVTPRIKDLISNGREDADFSLVLATIRDDAPVSWSAPEKTFSETFNFDALQEICNSYELRSMVDKFKRALNVTTVSPVVKENDTSNEDTQNSDLVISHDVDIELLRKIQIMRWLIDSRNMHEDIGVICNSLKVSNINDAFIELTTQLEKYNLTKLWEELEKPLIQVVESMHETGILLDVKRLEKLGKEMRKELIELEKKIHSYTGEINVQSPKQLGVALFDTLGLTPAKIKKTPGGDRSTKEEELIKMRELHPVIDLILEYREKQKLVSTYIEPLPTLVDNENRLHPIYWQDGTVTGRFSSEKPNIQNLPIRTSVGKQIREAVIARPGYTLLKMDYSQIELRITALLSNDPFMKQVFLDGRDIHTEVACKVFSVQASDVSSEMRRKAKVINFGIIYGMGVVALQKSLGATRAEAQTFYNEYFAQFPSIQNYFDAVIGVARKFGYTTTLFNRRRYFPDLNSKAPQFRATAERMSMNAPIQGTAADVMKCAMLDAYKVLQDFPKSHMIAQVHDELLFEVHDEDAAKIIAPLKNALEGVLKKHAVNIESVPLKVEAMRGNNWGDMQSV